VASGQWRVPCACRLPSATAKHTGYLSDESSEDPLYCTRYSVSSQTDTGHTTISIICSSGHIYSPAEPRHRSLKQIQAPQARRQRGGKQSVTPFIADPHHSTWLGNAQNGPTWAGDGRGAHAQARSERILGSSPTRAAETCNCYTRMLGRAGNWDERQLEWPQNAILRGITDWSGHLPP
jgi:hypothetical protein